MGCEHQKFFFDFDNWTICGSSYSSYNSNLNILVLEVFKLETEKQTDGQRSITIRFLMEV